MLWSPNEVLAYLKEDLNLQNPSIDKEEKNISKTAAFGGFPTWPLPEQDFVFIAENSEIYGPNPLFTIPCQTKEIDLNTLSTRILSADYQGLSSKKTVSLNHAQLLMPDASKNIHVAVNYFVLFDTEARGFIRPTCVAYVTSDKYKLICLADSILNTLSEASTILQHCNMLYIIKDLKAMLQQISSHTAESDASKSTTPDKITEDVTKDIKDIIDVIEAYEGNEIIDKQLSAIFKNLKKSSAFSDVSKLLNSSSMSVMQPLQWKHRNHFNLQKSMKNLYLICGNGMILGLYHLYMMYKHFRRKYEDLYLSRHFQQQKGNNENLYFGACVKSSDMHSGNFSVKDCILRLKSALKVPSLDSEKYFISLDATFNKVLLDFFNGEKNSFYDSGQNSSFHQSSGGSDISTEPESVYSSCSGYLSSESEEADYWCPSQCGHIVPLESIWDILEDLQSENSGIESAFLEILKLFDDTQRLLFSVLTRNPVVIISTPEEDKIAQNFIKALSVFIPRRKDEVVVIELNRQEPLAAEHFKYIAAVNVCVQHNKSIEEMIPQHIWHSLCVLNLRDCSLTAPAYTGVLLSNIDERFRMLPLDGPAFPIIVGILCDVQSAVQWWLRVTLPSVDASAASSSILSKGFSRLDVQILLKLSKLCRS